MNLTSEQIDALQQGTAVRLLPPEIGKECVLLLADVYERVKAVIDTDDQAALGWEAGRKIGWDTPEMAEYDNYDAHHEKG